MDEVKSDLKTNQLLMPTYQALSDKAEEALAPGERARLEASAAGFVVAAAKKDLKDALAAVAKEDSAATQLRFQVAKKRLAQAEETEKKKRFEGKQARVHNELKKAAAKAQKNLAQKKAEKLRLEREADALNAKKRKLEDEMNATQRARSEKDALRLKKERDRQREIDARLTEKRKKREDRNRKRPDYKATQRAKTKRASDKSKRSRAKAEKHLKTAKSKNPNLSKAARKKAADKAVDAAQKAVDAAVESGDKKAIEKAKKQLKEEKKFLDEEALKTQSDLEDKDEPQGGDEPEGDGGEEEACFERGDCLCKYECPPPSFCLCWWMPPAEEGEGTDDEAGEDEEAGDEDKDDDKKGDEEKDGGVKEEEKAGGGGGAKDPGKPTVADPKDGETPPNGGGGGKGGGGGGPKPPVLPPGVYFQSEPEKERKKPPGDPEKRPTGGPKTKDTPTKPEGACHDGPKKGHRYRTREDICKIYKRSKEWLEKKKNTHMAVFLAIQTEILKRLCEGTGGLGKKKDGTDDAERIDWLVRVLEVFMDSLFNYLKGNNVDDLKSYAAGGGYGEKVDRDVADGKRSGPWWNDLKRLTKAWTKRYRRHTTEFVAFAMAERHIMGDLATAIGTQGIGTDADWDALGKTVAKATEAVLGPIGAETGLLRWVRGKLRIDIPKMRTMMRANVTAYLLRRYRNKERIRFRGKYPKGPPKTRTGTECKAEDGKDKPKKGGKR